jgi:predicted metal-dependent peptidase
VYTNEKARKAVIKARTALLIDQPFFGCLALHLALVEVLDPNDVDTMAVDGFYMYYHPPFVLGLSEVHLMGVVAHEVFHCCYKHFSRRGQRNPQVWNYAGDYVINADLKKANIKLPEPHLYDAKYDGMGTEEVYARLEQQMAKMPKLIINILGGKGKGSKGDNGKDPTGCGGVIDAGSKNKKDMNGNPLVPDKANRDWEANVRIAIGVARQKNAGRVPGYLERLVKELEKPKVNWKDQLRDFVDGNMTKEFSWSRPNRRALASGLLLPGMIPDALHHLVNLIDVSGSVSHELARSMVSESAGALDDGVCDRLTVAYFDTGIRTVDEFMRGDLVQAKTVDGGGTNYTQPLQWLSELGDVSAAVMLTDMCPSTWQLEDPGVPLLWGAFCPEQYLSTINVPFGRVIHVDGA